MKRPQRTCPHTAVPPAPPHSTDGACWVQRLHPTAAKHHSTSLQSGVAAGCRGAPSLHPAHSPNRRRCTLWQDTVPLWFHQSQKKNKNMICLSSVHQPQMKKGFLAWGGLNVHAGLNLEVAFWFTIILAGLELSWIIIGKFQVHWLYLQKLQWNFALSACQIQHLITATPLPDSIKYKSVAAYSSIPCMHNDEGGLCCSFAKKWELKIFLATVYSVQS